MCVSVFPLDVLFISLITFYPFFPKVVCFSIIHLVVLLVAYFAFGFVSYFIQLSQISLNDCVCIQRNP